MSHHKRKSCRVCGGNQFDCLLSFGEMPLANSFVRSSNQRSDEKRYPLDVYVCKHCALVQLLDVVEPELLFRNYFYVSGTSETLAEHHRQYAATIVKFAGLGHEDLLVEIGSNDGNLIKCFDHFGVTCLGIDPSTNIAEKISQNGHQTLTEFFTSSLATQVRRRHGPAKVVVANNVLAHVDDVQDFLRGCEYLLSDDGLLVIEVPHLRALIDNLEYDTIYHEHLSYFSVTALARLYETAGMSITRIDYFPVHGGTVRLYAVPQKRSPRHADEVGSILDQERATGLTEPAHLRQFVDRVFEHRKKIRTLVEELTGQGKTVVGYGAPAKSTTLLNYCGIGSHLIPYIVDKSSMKIGLFTPGTYIPILPVSTLLERQPDYVMILAWNFAEEIMRQQQEYSRRGGRFIIPIPEPRII